MVFLDQCSTSAWTSAGVLPNFMELLSKADDTPKMSSAFLQSWAACEGLNCSQAFLCWVVSWIQIHYSLFWNGWSQVVARNLTGRVLRGECLRRIQGLFFPMISRHSRFFFKPVSHLFYSNGTFCPMSYDGKSWNDPYIASVKTEMSH